MAELEVKRLKLEATSDRDRESNRLIAEERQTAARERMMEKEHQRQREQEEHNECMLRMQIELARAQASSRLAPTYNLPLAFPGTDATDGTQNFGISHNNYGQMGGQDVGSMGNFDHHA